MIKPLNESTTVSQKKLEKAEAKLREKQEKRARDGGTNGENKYRKISLKRFSLHSQISRVQARLEEAVVSQATNKKLLTDSENSDSASRS